jgi:CRP/FNR family cyclic AMP-dependent transcriptional regulator
MLARLPFLEGTPPEAFAALLSAVHWVEADPGQTIIDFDDATTDMFFILQGSLRVLVRTADGARTQIFGDFQAGDMVGEYAAIDEVPRSARVEALVRSRLCVVPAAAFLDLALSSRSVGLRLLRLLTARIRAQNRRLLEHAVLPIRMRLAAELLRLGRPRPDGTRVLTPPPTHDELAARSGARRESISRELAALDQAGLLRRTRTAIVVTEPESLRVMVEAGMDQPAG